LLEFFLAGNPNLPGQYFPRVSGMRFRYDPSRPEYDLVTQIELGDLATGYRVIDVTEQAKDLYSVSCNLYVGIVAASIPAKTQGKLPLAPKKKDGTPLKSRVDALPDLPQTGPYLLPPQGTIDKDEVVNGTGAASSLEIKEWQAIMDYLKSLPTKNDRGIAVLELDERSTEIRAIKVRA
jgi:5'-nucleotidase